MCPGYHSIFESCNECGPGLPRVLSDISFMEKGMESRASFPTPNDLKKDKQSQLKPLIDKLRFAVVEQIKKRWDGIHETGIEYSLGTVDTWAVIIEEAERAGWKVRLQTERNETWVFFSGSVK